MSKPEDEAKLYYSTLFATILLFVGIGRKESGLVKIGFFVFSGIFFLPLLIVILEKCERRGASYVNKMRERKIFRQITDDDEEV